jgi:hypothetical protein
VVVRDRDWPVGSWQDLVDRLDRAAAMTRWAATEPVLTGWVSVDDLPAVLARGTDRARADAVLGALVRCAAPDGGDDPDAVLVLLHLLRPGVFALAERLAGLQGIDGPAVPVVVAELVCRIRTFPWRRRPRSVAANLLLDTKRVLWRQHDRLSRLETHLVEPGSPWWETRPDHPDADPVPERELADLLGWAVGSDLVSAEDLTLLVDSERRGIAQIADSCGVHSRTVLRRRAHTLQRLRHARDRYLAAA